MKDKTSTKVIDVIKKQFPDNVDPATLIRLQEEVGPKIGEELKGKAILAIFWALLGIILYIWWRFELTFGLAAVAALFHDVLITIGIFSLLGKDISLSIVAALLTIVGYSLNDTIVVFDRVREDLKLYRKEPYGSVINHSINETLSRTIITSLTTFVVVLSLYIFGGSVIHDFAFALLVGVVVGTYSSIFVASPLELFQPESGFTTLTITSPSVKAEGLVLYVRVVWYDDLIIFLFLSVISTNICHSRLRVGIYDLTLKG
jgi:preprotein translocase SecF subunit